jgi:hypothetical protein
MSLHQPDIIDLPSDRFADMLGKVLAAQARLAPPPRDVATNPILPFDIAPDLKPTEHSPSDEAPLTLGDPEALLTLDDADPTDNTWLSEAIAAPPDAAVPDDDEDDVLVLDDEYLPGPQDVATAEDEPVGGSVSTLLQSILEKMAALDRPEATDLEATASVPADETALALDDTYEAVPQPDPIEDDAEAVLREVLDQMAALHDAETVAAALPHLDTPDSTDNAWQGTTVPDFELPVLDDAPLDLSEAEPPSLVQQPTESDVRSLLRNVLGRVATTEELPAAAEPAVESPAVDIPILEDRVPALEPVMVEDEPAPPQVAVTAPEPPPAVPKADLAQLLEGVLAEISLPLAEDVSQPEAKTAPQPQQSGEGGADDDGLNQLLQGALTKMTALHSEPAAEEPPPPAVKATPLPLPPPAPVVNAISDEDLTPLLQGVLSKLSALDDGAAPPEAEDVLVLEESQIVLLSPPAPEMPIQKPVAESRDIGALLQNVLSAMTTLQDDAIPHPEAAAPKAAAAAAVPEPEADILILSEDMAAPATTPPSPEPVAPPPPEPVAPSPPAAHTAEDLERLVSVTTPPGSGSLELPARLDALATLLTATPSDDFQCLDLLYACWPKGTLNCTSRALLAVAGKLATKFGLPGEKLPMATSKAWRMLDPTVFEFSLATHLGAIGDFIVNWQKAQKTFLVLEFAEIELIEYLFESLHPADHQAQLVAVMNFKVLSNRRLGLLRRIPARARKSAERFLPADRQGALVQLAHYKALLERIGDPSGFAPIVEAAERAIEEVDKHMKQVAGPPPGPPGGGMPLGRIGG